VSSFGELAMVSKYRRPTHRRMLALTVIRSERLSPNFMSITLGGGDVAHLEPSGYDQNGRVFFAEPGRDDVVFPTSERWMLQYARQPAARRPRVRFYSIRRLRPDALEFDIEVALHDTRGAPAAPGSSWALAARPGDPVGFLDEGGVYGVAADATWQLLVGDESALPPILAILEQSPGLPAEVFLEVPTSDDIRTGILSPAGTRIHWLPRDDTTVKPGTLALQAVKDATLRPGRFSTWTAGESSLPTGIRRHLVGERGVAKGDIAFSGYWRQGKASLG
jgi:NADPH-dependent ferric siderophore reductase